MEEKYKYAIFAITKPMPRAYKSKDFSNEEYQVLSNEGKQMLVKNGKIDMEDWDYVLGYGNTIEEVHEKFELVLRENSLKYTDLYSKITIDIGKKVVYLEGSDLIFSEDIFDLLLNDAYIFLSEKDLSNFKIEAPPGEK